MHTVSLLILSNNAPFSPRVHDCGRQHKISLLNFLARVPPTDCLLKPLHLHFHLICPSRCQTRSSCSDWFGEDPMVPRHAPHADTPKATGPVLLPPPFQRNCQSASESRRQRVCRLDAVIRSICLMYLFLIRYSSFKLCL